MTSATEPFPSFDPLQRYLFYPEGTRRANAPDADEPGALKAGGLKNIYEVLLAFPRILAASASKRACGAIYRLSKGHLSKWSLPHSEAIPSSFSASDQAGDAAHIVITVGKEWIVNEKR